jgi:hypothetical protein
MHGAIPPLPQYVFMAWCLVKHRDNFTFILTFRLIPRLLKLSFFVFSVGWRKLAKFRPNSIVHSSLLRGSTGDQKVASPRCFDWTDRICLVKSWKCTRRIEIVKIKIKIKIKVKVKLSLYLIMYHAMKTYWGVEV